MILVLSSNGKNNSIYIGKNKNEFIRYYLDKDKNKQMVFDHKEKIKMNKKI